MTQVDKRIIQMWYPGQIDTVVTGWGRKASTEYTVTWKWAEWKTFYKFVPGEYEMADWMFDALSKAGVKVRIVETDLKVLRESS